MHAKTNALWRYHERTGGIISINTSRHHLLKPGDTKNYELGPTLGLDLPTKCASELALKQTRPVTAPPPIPDMDEDIDDVPLEELVESFEGSLVFEEGSKDTDLDADGDAKGEEVQDGNENEEAGEPTAVSEAPKEDAGMNKPEASEE